MGDVITQEVKNQRVDVDTCTRCRKKFEEGHRVTQVLIFDRAGRDPQNIMRVGVHIKQEFEFAHVDCADPYLLQPPNK